MQKLYFGIDIGTNSVGMSCTDEEYRLIRAKGKDCWAVRLFDESRTAVERRSFRTMRRRLDRRKERIKFLQGLFAPYMEDKYFFIRLNNSQFYPEDKDGLLNSDKNNLFAQTGYTDKEYYKEYPTIFHLRKALSTVNDITDLRLYYLAIHHVVKYRGHFLFEGGMSDIRDIRKLFGVLNAMLSSDYDMSSDFFDIEKAEAAKEILMLPSKDKQKKLEELFGIDDAFPKEIIKGICGYAVKPKILFEGQYADEKSISFNGMNDEEFEALQSVFGDGFDLLSAMRAIYNFVTFEKILDGNENISGAMVALYEKHKKDLNMLKEFIRENASREEYNKLFKKTDQNANYVNYIGYTKKGGDKIKVKRCKDEEFFAYLKKFIVALPQGIDESKREEILREIENDTFLPKILHADNGLFPHQINQDELDKILVNMEKNCPQTAGIAEKIKKIFLYRIPYFVGPLTGKNSWVVRKRDEKITPWNLTDVVDYAASNEAFMRKMTNKCSYLYGEDVLPKGSVIYQTYNVLNQINKLKINGQPISVELKQAIFNELFVTRKKVTDSAVKDLLVRHGKITPDEKKTVSISGKDGEISATLSSYIQLKKILGDFVDDDLRNGGGVCEKIILWHTLNTDKNIVEALISNNYGNVPAIKNNLKALKGLAFKDFGRLSKKFLTELKTLDGETGAYLSVIDLLYGTNENLNEILFNEKYSFNELIRRENGETDCGITVEDVDNLYVSPAVRRGIWQSLKMADEYVTAIGKTPDKIFIEVTREDGVKGNDGRKQSRQKKLLELYKNTDVQEELKESLKNVSDVELRQERLYLYYRQLGKCMYSGEQIDLETLNTNLYDVDHILPRTYIKDDSMDNKVLVCRSCNARKSDRYPVPFDVVSDKARVHWVVLYKKGLISEVTYKRLTRVEPLNEDDYNDFINRQKTVTDQTVKAVAELLARKYPKAKIVYSKAKNVSEFRQKFDLYKCRETNDFHHAKDAYLNIVVGNVYDTCFSTPMAQFYKKGEEWRTYNLKTMFHRNVKGAWTDDGNLTLNIVKKTCAKAASVNVTRYSYCNQGAFYDQTVYPHTDKSITASRKSNSPLSDVSKYGGYKSQKTAYFSVVQSEDKNGKAMKTIEAVPVMTAYTCKDDDGLQRYFNGYLKNAKILVPKLKIKQLVRYNGTPCYIAGVTGNNIIVHNGVELFTDNKTDEYVNALSKLAEMKKTSVIDVNAEEYIIKTNRDGVVKLKICKERNIELYALLLKKLSLPEYRGPGPVVTYNNVLLNCKAGFENISTLEQAAVLLQILRFFRCNAEQSDLSLIGGPKMIGTIRVNKNITGTDFSIIHKSPCGLTQWEQKV